MDVQCVRVTPTWWEEPVSVTLEGSFPLSHIYVNCALLAVKCVVTRQYQGAQLAFLMRF